MFSEDTDPARDLLARTAATDGLPVLRIGFIPLADCAPIIAAHVKGFAAAEGLALDLVRETSWANIRDRVALGHFDAAHMLGPMPIAGRLGLGHWKTPMLAPFVLNEGGNAVTVGIGLHEEMLATGETVDVFEPASTARAIATVVARRATEGRPPLTVATVYPFSAHNYEMRYWLAAAGLDPDRDIRLVVVPPPLMVDALTSGNIEVFSVGAPWPSLAVEAGVGRIVATKQAVWPHSPEKVLGVREHFAQRSPEKLAALIRALARAAAWCADPDHMTELAAILARAEIIGVEAEIILRGITSRLVTRLGQPATPIPHYMDFAFDGSNRPRVADGMWFASQMVRWGQVADPDAAYEAARRAFDPAYFDAALGADAPPAPAERPPQLFDGPVLDLADPGTYVAGFSIRRSARPDETF